MISGKSVNVQCSNVHISIHFKKPSNKDYNLSFILPKQSKKKRKKRHKAQAQAMPAPIRETVVRAKRVLKRAKEKKRKKRVHRHIVVFAEKK